MEISDGVSKEQFQKLKERISNGQVRAGLPPEAVTKARNYLLVLINNSERLSQDVIVEVKNGQIPDILLAIHDFLSSGFVDLNSFLKKIGCNFTIYFEKVDDSLEIRFLPLESLSPGPVDLTKI